MIEPLWLDISDICDIHNEVILDSGGSSGILNQGALESTLSKPKNLYCYSGDGNLYRLAASYGYGLTKNHCFIDGNKRTAFITAYTFLLNNGIRLIASNENATTTFLELAASFANQEEDIEKLSNWLKVNSISISD
jgi:death on curing protein